MHLPRLQPDSTPSTLQRNVQAIRQQRLTHKQRIKEYLRRSTSQFFGVDQLHDDYEQQKWEDRQKRFAIRRFGSLKDELPPNGRGPSEPSADVMHDHLTHSDRPDVLPAQSQDEPETEQNRRQRFNPYYRHEGGEEFLVERKPSVSRMMLSGLVFVVQSLRNRVPRRQKQWSRSFAPAHVALNNDDNDIYDGLTPVQEDEMFFDVPAGGGQNGAGGSVPPTQQEQDLAGAPVPDNSHQIYMLETDRALVSSGWRTRGVGVGVGDVVRWCLVKFFVSQILR